MANGQKAEIKGDMNLVKLIEQYGSEDKCHAYLEELRWPNGVRCPRCDSDKISRIRARRQFDCDSCRYQFSVRVGTLFHDSKLPLWKWFLATYLMCESRKGISANQLKRTLGVSYKTAWYLCHRIRAAMVEPTETPLSGIVEADETWVGGRRPQKHRTNYGGKSGGKGDWRKDRSLILGAVERDGKVRLRVERRGATGTSKDVHGFLAGAVSDDAEAIYTDGLLSYQGIGDENTRHEWVDHSADEWVRGDVHTQTIEGVWSLFKRSIIGSYHHLSVKHLAAYVDEMEWRYNNRENPYLFRDTILRLVEGETLPYRELVTGKPPE
jgi:transposase-like protein